MAGESLCPGADKVIPALGDLLKYGLMGFALAVLIVVFFSVVMLQRQRQTGGTSAEALASMERLMKAGMGLVVVLAVLVVAAQMLNKAIPAADAKSKYAVSFNVDPSQIDDSGQLLPQLVVSGSGAVIALKNGTGSDTIEGERSYLFRVGSLAKEIQRLNMLVLEQTRSFEKERSHDRR